MSAFAAKRFGSVDDAREYGPGGYTFDEAGNLLLNLPIGGLVRFNTTRKNRQRWKIAPGQGPITVTPGLSVQLAGIKWEGVAVPERELWSGSLVEGHLISA